MLRFATRQIKPANSNNALVISADNAFIGGSKTPKSGLITPRRARRKRFKHQTTHDIKRIEALDGSASPSRQLFGPTSTKNSALAIFKRASRTLMQKMMTSKKLEIKDDDSHEELAKNEKIEINDLLVMKFQIQI